MRKKTRSPNDQRSDVKNPNNGDFKAAQDNLAKLINPASVRSTQKSEHKRANR